MGGGGGALGPFGLGIGIGKIVPMKMFLFFCKEY